MKRPVDPLPQAPTVTVQTAPDIPPGAYQQSFEGRLEQIRKTHAEIVEIEQMMDIELDPGSELYKKLRALLSTLRAI